MSETEGANGRRADIALRNRRRTAESRERKLSMVVFGLMAYSAFANVVSGAMLVSKLPLAAGLGVVLGVLYGLGAYRVWSRDDTRWWPVAVPASISLAFLLLGWLAGNPHPVPVLINIVLLVLVPIRRRAAVAVLDNGAKAHTSGAV